MSHPISQVAASSQLEVPLNFLEKSFLLAGMKLSTETNGGLRSCASQGHRKGLRGGGDVKERWKGSRRGGGQVATLSGSFCRSLSSVREKKNGMGIAIGFATGLDASR